MKIPQIDMKIAIFLLIELFSKEPPNYVSSTYPVYTIHYTTHPKNKKDRNSHCGLCFSNSLDHTQFFPHTLERLQALIKIILRVRSRDHYADSRLALWHGREADRHGEHTRFE